MGVDRVADSGRVEFSATPGSRIWVAAVVGLGAAILALTLFFGLAEVAVAVKRPLLEAMFAGKP